MGRRKKKGSPADAVAGVVLLLVVYAVATHHVRQLLSVTLLLLAACGVFLIWRQSNSKPIDLERRSTPNTDRTPPWPIEKPLQREIGRDGGRSPIVSPASPIVSTGPSSWSLELIRTLEWKRFEELCCLLWRALGYVAETTGTGADGGVDIKLYGASEPRKLLAVVQCKSRIRENIGVAVVRELFGVMHHVGAPMGIVMTTSGFYADAVAFAKGKHLQLVGGQQILERIRTLSNEKQIDLLTQVTAGDYITPTCPNCDQKLVLRLGKPPRGGFWGCRNFPVCRYTVGARSLQK